MNVRGYVHINPGTGPVPGARLASATANMKHFIADCELKEINVLRCPEMDEDGRFAFLLWKETRCHLIEMPGLPLHQVRFMAEDGQNPWDFPRLYVDGSSWLWMFSIQCAQDFKEPEEE